jgi:hypothetical protein
VEKDEWNLHRENRDPIEFQNPGGRVGGMEDSQAVKNENVSVLKVKAM